MDDLTITNLCAEAMGGQLIITPDQQRRFSPAATKPWMNVYSLPTYDPIHDDAQAMALAKKLRLNLNTLTRGRWLVCTEGSLSARFEAQDDSDLNRAVCLCVAKMQQAKHA